MLGWLKRKLGVLGGDRLIYRYWDGSRRRYGDPMILYRDLRAKGGDHWQGLLSVVSSASAIDPAKLTPRLQEQAEQQSLAAAATLVKLVREVFGCPPLDGGSGAGLTEGECLALLSDFLVYIGGLAEAARPLPNSPPATGYSPDAGGPDTGPSAASTSAATSPESSGPKTLPTESPSP